MCVKLILQFVKTIWNDRGGLPWAVNIAKYPIAQAE